MATDDLVVRVWDRSMGFLGILDDLEEMDLSIFHNDTAVGTFTVSNRNRMLGDLLTDGTRLTVDYAGEQVACGLLDQKAGEVVTPGGQVALTLTGDFNDLLKQTLGWPNPAQVQTPGTVFTTTPTYDVVSGPAETVVKTLVGANARDRLGRPITVAADQGRGASVKVQFRNHPLFDRLFPVVTNAGIGVSVQQVDGQLVVDCYEPATFPLTLTPESGIVTSAQFSIVAPTITRDLTMGQGQFDARHFVTYVDGGTEANWGMVREEAVDARDVDNDPDLIVRSQEKHIEDGGQRKTGFSVTLQETPAFRYGVDLHLGDTVNESLLPDGVKRSHTVTEVQFTFKAGDGQDGGLRVTPVIGDITDNYHRALAQALARQAAKLRDLGAME